jgi:L-lactate dehydrogenase (cytochrome)
VEDVELCVNAGVEGVVLVSAHQCKAHDSPITADVNATCKLSQAASTLYIADECSAPAPIDILYEMRATRPDLFDKIEVMMDGGVRSGSDVVKALALGAKAVGLGRPFLYANGTHGEEGVVRVCQSELADWLLELRRVR